MAHLPTIQESTAEGDVKRIFGEIRREKRLPFVPNFFKTLALAPKSLEATWMAYRGITTNGALPEALKYPSDLLRAIADHVNARLGGQDDPEAGPNQTALSSGVDHPI